MPIDIRQDLHDARLLLEQAGSEEEKRKYRKAAEIILLKAVHQEPDNEEAKILLQSARAVPVGFSARAAEAIRSYEPVKAPEPFKAPEPVRAPEPIQFQEPIQAREPMPAHEPVNKPEPLKLWEPAVKAPTSEMREEELPFVAAPVFKSIESGNKGKSGLKLPLGLIATVVIVGGGLWMLQSRPANKPALAAAASRTQSANSTTPAGFTDSAHSSLVPAPAPATSAGETKPSPALAQPTNTTPPPAPTPVVSSPPPPAAATPAAMGNLAVSSATVAEIYQGGRFLGSTPTTIQLPVGRQTLEYRHDNLRTVVTHDIKSNQTVTASVTFQENVQINSKPWAQVFLQGPTKRPLGQTPLSGVSVPIGGVLVFENPNFASKTYRITDKDTAIQVDFP
jgi:hypothetical protein